MTEEKKDPHYVTPRDAEISYCPMSMGGHEGKDLCVGPQCMAWRWKEKKQKQTPKSILRLEEPNLGYCGMVRN